MPPAAPAKTGAPVALTRNVTVRDAVAKGSTCNYSAAVSGGQAYVLSLTGIIGAVQLKVFNDPNHTQPTSCLSPKNLANSTFAQPADCTFVADTGTIYATVTGTSYLATDQNTYALRISPHYEAKAAAQGTQESPVAIQVNKPYGGTVGTGYTQTSYYVVNTTGSGKVVISLTGLTGEQSIDLRLYGNPDFTGPLNNSSNPYCYTGEFITYAESCELPAGKTYYIAVLNYKDGVGGPFTLMVDAQGAKAVPASPTNLMQQAAPNQGKRAPPPVIAPASAPMLPSATP
jgi:hypothetical protein